MLRKRIIFTLIYNQNYFMQSRNFRLQKVGDIAWLEKNYQFQKISFSIDELIILNATRTDKCISSFAETVSKISENVFIPIAAGGGINSIAEAEILFKQGADKIVLNTLLIKNPKNVAQLIEKYGSQSIIASIDYKKNANGTNEVFTENGNTKIDLSLPEYISYLENLGVGEIYLNSIDKDGTGFGYDIETIDQIDNLNIPLIIAGGAGNEKHLLEGLKFEHVSAVATANLFNFIGNSLPIARQKILENKINIAKWEFDKNGVL